MVQPPRVAVTLGASLHARAAMRPALDVEKLAKALALLAQELAKRQPRDK
ncbi:hypothetical protein GCM10023225_15560 [Kineococcus glutinatus]|uniref:Uncharacterized protein n=1 Tax=Kineococcus glutinatus TaxID=1070872 RepID=A0ABP9HPN7_9ACTN